MSQTITKPPMQATIEGLSHDGRGLTHLQGKTTFVAGALPNERVHFRYTKRHASFDEGQVIDIIEANPSRLTPHCAHFSICGGCSLQYMESDAQIAHKQKALLELLNRENIHIQDILPPLRGKIWGYRRKARLSVKFLEKKNTVLVGFREKNSHFVAAIERCEILHPHIGHLIKSFSELFLGLEIRREIPQLEIAVTDKETAIIVRHLSLLPEKDREKLRDFCKAHHIKLYLQPHGIDSIALDWPLESEPYLTETLPDHQLKLQFMPNQFVQINSDINQKMIAQALKLLDLQNTDRVLDLFCGIGNFTLPIAKYSAHVTGVEGDLSAVKQAKINSEINQLKNTAFFCDDLSVSDYNKQWASQSFDKILLDPPRVGAKGIFPWIPQWQANRIVYISCNPATLARDAKALVELGYKLVTLGVMDMFPHTQHIEAMALFIKK